MKTLLLLLLSVGLATASELTDLQAKYNKASNKALEPINAVYTAELQKLLEKYSKDGNIEEVAKITDELKKFSSLDNKPDVALSNNYFVGKIWVSQAGTEYKFDKDGTGLRNYIGTKTGFTWRALDNNIIEVSGRNTPNSEVRMWYFLFDKKKDTFFGENIKDIHNPISLKK